MIIWGSGNTGGRYDPTTDSWSATSLNGVPSGRAAHTAVWTGTEMIVWGGFNNGNLIRTGGRYNPSTDSWTSTSITNAPAARGSHTAVWSDSEMIIWGGCTAVGFGCTNFANTGGRYNPSTDSWTSPASPMLPLADGSTLRCGLARK